MKKQVAFLSTLFLTIGAQAQEVAAAATTGDKGLYAIAAGICLGIAVVGGALGQAKAGASALEGISRNPGASDKIFVPMILSLAFIESLVLFAFALAFLMKP
jgi:F-type H+-transporting ATPase subunit c